MTFSQRAILKALYKSFHVLQHSEIPTKMIGKAVGQRSDKVLRCKWLKYQGYHQQFSKVHGCH
eukprot:c38584_g1_i1 orf=1-186(-)